MLGRTGLAHRLAFARRLAVAAAAAGCVGLATLGQSSTLTSDVTAATAQHTQDQRTQDQHASRSATRPTPSTASGATVAGGQSTKAKSATAGTKPASAATKASAAPVPPKPVAGLSQTQMNNAARIVAAGKAQRLPKRAYVVAVACAMQESNLLNLASDVIPESRRYAHEGSGSDHDSVGLFQQRPSSGWGSVRNLMRPSYAATKFYQALVSVPGWQKMRLTYAVQAVQVSAFPEAYAKHESRAQAVVNALT